MNGSRWQSGYIMIMALVMGLLLSTLGVIGAQMLMSNARATKFEERQAKALDVAEAGVNYYLWHLAHNPTDYQDGTGAPATAPYGPYTHTYVDNDGNTVGTYSITITPPSNGSTVTTVSSKGSVPGLAGGRTILAQLGQPSFSNYVLLSATEVWFGSSESSTGPVHSNVGVHFDGVNNGPVFSASSTYKPTPQFGGDGTIHNGVWGNGGPQSQWQFPVPAIDFSKVTADLQKLSTAAQAGGLYLPATSGQGYYLMLKPNDTIDVYKVNNETNAGLNKTFLYNKPTPTNGILFASDEVWVEGTNWDGRMTVVASRLPDNAATNASINIVGNITYAAKDGTDALGFIAQKDIHVADYAPNNLEIDGALLAQKGHVWVDSNAPVKTALSLYGAIATYDYWTWSWVNNGGTVTAGYPTTSNSFDAHLIYAPPPLYPTTGNYSVLNWREQLFNP